jgi:hypothetical protein
MDVIKQNAYILLQPLICEARRTTVADAVTTLAVHVEWLLSSPAGSSGFLWVLVGKGAAAGHIEEDGKKPRASTHIAD